MKTRTKIMLLVSTFAVMAWGGYALAASPDSNDGPGGPPPEE